MEELKNFLVMFLTTKTTTAAKLGIKKSRILGVFSKAQEELIELMEEQVTYENELADKISVLEIEKSAVDKEINSTRKLLKKISEFLD